jgi:hypothetical protein
VGTRQQAIAAEHGLLAGFELAVQLAKEQRNRGEIDDDFVRPVPEPIGARHRNEIVQRKEEPRIKLGAVRVVPRCTSVWYQAGGAREGGEVIFFDIQFTRKYEKPAGSDDDVIYLSRWGIRDEFRSVRKTATTPQCEAMKSEGSASRESEVGT